MSIYEVRLESYLQSLRETRIPNEEHDYNVLFPSKKNTTTKKPTSTSSTARQEQIMSSLFKSLDVENEVINQYFQRPNGSKKEKKTLPQKRKSNFDDEEEEEDDNVIIIQDQQEEKEKKSEQEMEDSQLDMTSDFEFVVATQVDIQNRVKQKKENEQILKWSNYLEDPTSNLSKLNEFFSLPDNIFEAVCTTINMGSMSIEVLTKILTAACSDKNISNKNLEALTHYGLVPKACESNVPLRTVYQLYQKILNASNPSVIIYGILLPMFKKNAAIPKPFWKHLNSIDKNTCFILAITWMEENYMELSSQNTLNLFQLLDGMTDVDDQKQDTIVKLLERSMRYNPRDEDISSFFLRVVDKYGQVMSESNLKELQKLSYSNESTHKNPIQIAIKKHLTAFS